MSDTDALRLYTVGNPPTLPNSDKLYLSDELKKVQMSIGLLIKVVKALEARMVANGI